MSGFAPLRRLYAYMLWYSALPGLRATASLRIAWAPAQSLRSEACAARSSTGSTGPPDELVSAAAKTAPGAATSSDRTMGRKAERMVIRVPLSSELALYIRAMGKLDAPLRIVLFALLTAAACAAFPAPENREQALRDLASPDTATRAEAVVWIANHGTMRDAGLLHERLRDESAFVRGFAEQGLWLLWSRSGDPAVDRDMAQASDLMQAGQYPAAIEILTKVIKQKPDFAESWNRRATVYYLAGQYQKSIADCDQVLKRNPRHFEIGRASCRERV